MAYGSFTGLVSYYGQSRQPKSWKKAFDLIQEVLRGSYQVDNGEERIVLENNRYAKINFASSGQQQSVWILNLLFCHLIQARPTMFILEEPESHLFPQTQKAIVELIALVANQGHSMLVTTHSPYVLGTLNNLLYAASFKGHEKQAQAAEVIPDPLWLKREDFSAWFVRDGRLEDCMDSEIGLIQNEKIDEISDVINQNYDRLFSR